MVELEEQPRDSVTARGGDLLPAKFGLVSLAAVVLPVSALYAIPQVQLPWPTGLLLIVILLAVFVGALGVAIGLAWRDTGDRANQAQIVRWADTWSRQVCASFSSVS